MTEKEILDLKNIVGNKAIKTVFQPIISLRDGEVLGHEALSRVICESGIENVEALFTLADQYNCLWELEQICRTRAFESAVHFMDPPSAKKLFINVNPNVLHDESFQKGLTKEYLNQYNISSRDVIFEITEKNIIKDIEGFLAAVDHYKSQAYKIAIDDAGAGYSGLNLISDINPNYIKLDMKLIRDVHKDSLKAALVKGMVELSKISNIAIVAEGIETEKEMEALIGLGVQYGQGFYIQHPEAEVQDIDPALVNRIIELNLKKNNTAVNGLFNNMYIENLCSRTGTVSPKEPVPDVYDIFRHDPACFGLCVTEDDVPVGIVTKESLALKLSGHYGFALYQKKPISHIMDRDFLSVDCKAPVNNVSSAAMARKHDKLYDFIVVKKDGKYLGTVTIRDLLQKSTEIELVAAKHQNPLTGLPGNLLIEQRLRQGISNKEKYSVAYLDIDNFKSYNDVYGFEKGDQILKLLAAIISKNMNKGEFVGHVGGDDFVVIVSDHVDVDFFQNIVTEFEREVLNYYSQEDIEKGYIVAANRQNVTEKFPLTTLTLVSANNRDRSFRDVYELTETLAGLKKAKKLQLRLVI
jgi:diguanylate cyclase (GGDEF)-like protein